MAYNPSLSCNRRHQVLLTCTPLALVRMPLVSVLDGEWYIFLTKKEEKLVWCWELVYSVPEGRVVEAPPSAGSNSVCPLTPVTFCCAGVVKLVIIICSGCCIFWIEVIENMMTSGDGIKKWWSSTKNNSLRLGLRFNEWCFSLVKVLQCKYIKNLQISLGLPGVGK